VAEGDKLPVEIRKARVERVPRTFGYAIRLELSELPDESWLHDLELGTWSDTLDPILVEDGSLVVRLRETNRNYTMEDEQKLLSALDDLAAAFDKTNTAREQAPSAIPEVADERELREEALETIQANLDAWWEHLH